jgi:hypothetical protein
MLKPLVRVGPVGPGAASAAQMRALEAPGIAVAGTWAHEVAGLGIVAAEARGRGFAGFELPVAAREAHEFAGFGVVAGVLGHGPAGPAVAVADLDLEDPSVRWRVAAVLVAE